MAKRRSILKAALAAKKLSKQQGMTNPSSESRYARKKKGSFTPQPDPRRRPSWFVRIGMSREAEFRAVQIENARQGRAA